MANILVVDDESHSVRLLDIMLRRHGHHTTPAYSGPRALAELHKGGIDLVITDIMMPEMDGLELIDRIRAEEAYRTLPIIVVTANGLNRTAESALEKGATRFLTQPYGSQELLNAVSACLDGQYASEAKTTVAAKTSGRYE